MGSKLRAVSAGLLAAGMLLSVPPLWAAQDLSADPSMIKLFEAQKQIAEKGDQKAVYHLAEMHEQGLGTPANPELARSMYMKLAEQGSPLAKAKIAKWEQNIQEQVQLALAEQERLRKAAAARVAADQERARKEAAARAEAEQRNARAHNQAQREKDKSAKLAASESPKATPAPAGKTTGETAPAESSQEQGFSANPCMGAAAAFDSKCNKR